MKPLVRENRICRRCGNPFVSNTNGAKRKYCSYDCSKTANTQYKIEYRKTRIKNGICRECGKPSRKGKATCSGCLEKNARKRHERVEKDPRIPMFTSAKARAKKGDIPFSISIDDIVIPEFCPVFGIELKKGYHKITNSSPTLDRIVPDLGYTKGNTVVMSRIANRLKNNASLYQLVQLGYWAEEVMKNAVR